MADRLSMSKRNLHLPVLKDSLILESANFSGVKEPENGQKSYFIRFPVQIFTYLAKVPKYANSSQLHQPTLKPKLDKECIYYYFKYQSFDRIQRTLDNIIFP